MRKRKSGVQINWAPLGWEQVGWRFVGQER